MAIPLLVSALNHEIAVVVDFLTAMSIGITISLLMFYLFPPVNLIMSWTQGMVVVSLSWLAATLFAALPYQFSGFWHSYLDTVFDVMSGFTTTGLTLVQDLDHIPDGINMWRHLLTWLGGQGIIVLYLSILSQSVSGISNIYIGEGKDERLFPNVISTARAIWFISVVYLIIGTLVFWITGLKTGLPLGRSFLHGLWIFMSSWSTGGFAPQSQGIIYYHSINYEIIAIIFFVIGSFNFNLHWNLFSGNRKEIIKNLEVITFTITVHLLVVLVLWDLSRYQTYNNITALFRRGYFSLISAHTTTGLMTVYARQFILEWGPLALLATTVAMLFGGSASSTAGGFKAVRVGIAFKAVIYEIKRLLYPEKAVLVEKIHMGKEMTIGDRVVRFHLTIIFLYLISWFIIFLFTSGCGYDLTSSLFESASVIGNVGFSCGVTGPTMPTILKIIYILGMWVGRLEFISVFVFVGFIMRIGRPS